LLSLLPSAPPFSKAAAVVGWFLRKEKFLSFNSQGHSSMKMEEDFFLIPETSKKKLTQKLHNGVQCPLQYPVNKRKSH